MILETVKLWKDGEPVIVNLEDKADRLAQGWTETPEAVKPVEKPVKSDKKAKGLPNV